MAAVNLGQKYKVTLYVENQTNVATAWGFYETNDVSEGRLQGRNLDNGQVITGLDVNTADDTVNMSIITPPGSLSPVPGSTTVTLTFENIDICAADIVAVLTYGGGNFYSGDSAEAATFVSAQEFNNLQVTAVFN